MFSNLGDADDLLGILHVDELSVGGDEECFHDALRGVPIRSELGAGKACLFLRCKSDCCSCHHKGGRDHDVVSIGRHIHDDIVAVCE